MRTDAEKRAFAMKCLEIEKEGGDVLGYIRDEYPSYTPRATWYNLQKRYLSRYSWQLTEGRPINPEERRLKELRADKAKQLDEILKVLEEGKDPIEYLEGLGYKAPTQVWADLKNWARKYRPDDRKKMPDNLKLYYADHGIQRTGTAPAVKKPVENPAKPEKVPETVKFAGKTYEKYEQPTEIVQIKGKDGHVENVKLYGEKPSPTCCQPARPSDVTVPDQLPEEKPNELHVTFDEAQTAAEKLIHGMKGIAEKCKTPKRPLRIHAVESEAYKTARYENSTLHSGSIPYMTFVWNDNQHGPCELTLTVDTWRRLIDEIPQALEQLGL